MPMKERTRHTLIALVCLLLLVPFLLPGGMMVVGLFFEHGSFTTSRVREAFSDPERTAILLKNSFIVIVGTLLISVGLGTVLGFLAFRTRLPLKRTVVVVLILASCIPLYTFMSAWMALFGKEFWMYKTFGACWIMGLALAPPMGLLLGTYFSSADRLLEESALLDTGARGVFAHVTLEQASWGVAIAALIVMILTISETTVTDVLGIHTFGEESRTQLVLHPREPSVATALAFPLIVVNLLCGYALYRVVQGRASATVEGFGTPPLQFRIPVARFAFSGLCFVLLTAFFLSPWRRS
jgi:ABC-type Fe3+ transport system permease subunit